MEIVEQVIPIVRDNKAYRQVLQDTIALYESQTQAFIHILHYEQPIVAVSKTTRLGNAFVLRRYARVYEMKHLIVSGVNGSDSWWMNLFQKMVLGYTIEYVNSLRDARQRANDYISRQAVR